MADDWVAETSGRSSSLGEPTYAREASCLFSLITEKRSVSRRNRASWFLEKLYKVLSVDPIQSILDDAKRPSEEIDGQSRNRDQEASPKSMVDSEQSFYSNEKDIFIVSITTPPTPSRDEQTPDAKRKIPFPAASSTEEKFLVTTNTRVVYLSKKVATTIVLDISPSVVTVSPQNDCVYLDSTYDAVKRALHLLVREQELPSSSRVEPNDRFALAPKVFVTVIAYTPYTIARSNQVLIQNRRISVANIDQVLVEIWISLNRLTQEIHELVSSTCEMNMEYEQAKTNGTAFVFPQPINGGIIRHPGSVLEDIYELGLFSADLMPKLSRLSILIITDGLFASTNNLNLFRLKSIAVSFIALGGERVINPDASFGYTPYVDLMRFVSKSTQGVYISHQDLIKSSLNLSKTKRMALFDNPLYKLFCWSLHTYPSSDQGSSVPALDMYHHRQDTARPDKVEMKLEHVAKFFCVDQPIDTFYYKNGSLTSTQSDQFNYNYHDWRSFKQLDRNLDADFEQVLSSLLREGYLIKSIQLKKRETLRIVARLVLYWKHNLDLEQELTASYWNNSDGFEISDSNNLILRPFNMPLYGDTYCEIIVHGSYSFLHNLYCDRKTRRRSEYRDVAYRQYRQLIDGILQTYDRLQYLSRFYRDSSLSKIPSYLMHGNSLLYEQPHTHRLTSAMDNVVDETKVNEFQEFWQKFSRLDTKSWKNLMHVHTVRLILEHDQPKHKNIHCQNANGRYGHILCRRSLSSISNFIKNYASFALLEDSTYVKLIYNKDDDLREIETSATKGFILIRINKLLPIIVIYLMFTSGILDSHRAKIVAYFESQLTECKVRNVRLSTASNPQTSENILKSKTIYSSGDSCCVLIRSPLERMLKVYGRNFVHEHLANNLMLGLPGSCPFNDFVQHRTFKSAASKQQQAATGGEREQNNPLKGCSDGPDDCSMTSAGDNHLINRYNLVFGKYLYGVRTVNSINNLPQSLVQMIASNILAKISAILVNVRIIQGFHIAFNNSGVLNLVTELNMQDHSHELHASSCLCQYIVFPAIISTNCQQSILRSAAAAVAAHTQVGEENADQLSSNVADEAAAAAASGSRPASKPASLSGSLVNSSDHSYLTSNPADAILSRQDTGEIKFIREYWIEQQYGISTSPGRTYYHKSLENKRYAEVVDHLYTTDSSIFECLVTYELLQLYCDRMSPYQDIDLLLTQAESGNGQNRSPTLSPTLTPTTNDSSSSSSSQADQQRGRRVASPIEDFSLPSELIEVIPRDRANMTRAPLIENEYRFSLVKFFDYCQLASLNVLLFRDKSNFFFSEQQQESNNGTEAQPQQQQQQQQDMMSAAGARKNSSSSQTYQQPACSNINCTSELANFRKLSMDYSRDHYSHYSSGANYQNVANLQQQQQQHSRRSHRISYDSLNLNSACSHNYVNPIYSPSLNHLFLDTLHKRLKQMHDKELTLNELDARKMSYYLRRRKILLEFGAMDDDDDDEEEDEDEDEQENEAEKKDNENNNDDNPREKTHSEAASSSSRKQINWRCFLRKGNQENTMIVLVPATIDDVDRWMDLVSERRRRSGQRRRVSATTGCDRVCPMFVFRCSCNMINDQLLHFLLDQNKPNGGREQDLSLNFGQATRYMGKLIGSNDELDSDILPLSRFDMLASNQIPLMSSALSVDERSLELVHFQAFLRKIKNTVLKSRFISLNDAYLSELFIHKDDILYYMNNVDLDTQKKYHVSSQLRSLAEFIKSYEQYSDSLPAKNQAKQCNQLLNSILLQKCGLFINQPMVRWDESNPLVSQMHDRKLIHLMRCNYRIQLPILEESLSGSLVLKNLVALRASNSAKSTSNQWTQTTGGGSGHSSQQSIATIGAVPVPRDSSAGLKGAGVPLASSLGRNSIGASHHHYQQQQQQQHHHSPTMNDGSNQSIASQNGGAAPLLADIETAAKCASTGYSGSLNITSSPSSMSLLGRLKSAQQQQQHLLSSASTSSIAIYPRFSSASSLPQQQQQHSIYLASPSNESFILEAFKHSACSMDEIRSSDSIYQTAACFALDANNQPNASAAAEPEGSSDEQLISLRHELHMAEVLRCKSERKESHQYRRVLKSKANHTNQSHGAIDQALRRVDSLGRLEHFCLTPLLFSPSWRSKLAPVRDHTIEPNGHYEPPKYELDNEANACGKLDQRRQIGSTGGGDHDESDCDDRRQQQADEKWHQMVCNNYIKEYEQYIQTLGFNSVQIRYQQQQQQNQHSTSSANARGVGGPYANCMPPPPPPPTYRQQSSGSNQKPPATFKRPQEAAAAATALFQPAATSNSGYLIKFLNSGCLVFKVGFCKPYVYSILYSIEGERFNNANTRVNMTAFLDELDNIKVTMHLHSFTYDYHLRSIFSYISGRQLTFNPGYHLVWFADDFRKYYQKAPNYARNRILSGDITIDKLRVSGCQLYSYIVAHNRRYNLDVLEMSNQAQASALLASSSTSSVISSASSRSPMLKQADEQQQQQLQSLGDFLQDKSQVQDYVLIELKREKVRYRDGKDPDIFDCGLLITHDTTCESTSAQAECLRLKYFLLLTNQRDLYPKLIHNDDNIITLGCHRPIRLKAAPTTTSSVGGQTHQSTVSKPADVHQQQQQQQQRQPSPRDTQDVDRRRGSVELASEVNSALQSSSCDLMSSDELTAADSLPFSSLETETKTQSGAAASIGPVESATDALDGIGVSKQQRKSPAESSMGATTGKSPAKPQTSNQRQSAGSSTPSAAAPLAATALAPPHAPAISPVGGEQQQHHHHHHQHHQHNGTTTTICDEEITYLGYFSSEEMDMLKFLQEKTTNLRQHIERIVRQAEVHYRRDYLWQKLMQRATGGQPPAAPAGATTAQPQTGVNQSPGAVAAAAAGGELASNNPTAQPQSVGGSSDNKSTSGKSAAAAPTQATGGDSLPLSSEELAQLLQIVDSVDLAALDQQLALFTSMHISWFMKLFKMFAELKQATAGVSRHRVHVVQGSKLLLLFIDPRCSSALVLLAVDSERASVQMNLLLKDKRNSVTDQKRPTAGSSSGANKLELHLDCQQLINDFINFCAAFMWSTLLT